MSKPQQPELGRSGHTPVCEGQHDKEVLQGQEQPGGRGFDRSYQESHSSGPRLWLRPEPPEVGRR
jgi:hypothetical protein